MPTWTINAEPVTGTGIDEAISQYFTEIGLRVLGRPATEAECREALNEDPHDNLGPPYGEFLVARDGDGELLGYAKALG
jgi:hypothetical protein